MNTSRLDTSVIEDFDYAVRYGVGTVDAPRPGILVFHGWGHNEQILLKRLRHLDERLTVIAPRGPIDSGNGFGWYWRRDQIIADRSSFDTAVERLDHFIQTMQQRFQIDPARLIVLGFSQGAGLATSLARMNATRFAGTVSLSGPPLPIPLLYEAPEHLIGHPVFMAHGRNDITIPLEHGQIVRDTMLDLGARVTFHAYDYRHEISADTVADLNVWIRGVLGFPALETAESPSRSGN